jgi:hypothetical protein
MASNLLRTLQKIENGRLGLINAYNSKGFNLPNNSSFSDIIGCINNVPEDYLSYKSVVRQKWVRPIEWPDSYSIFNNAEDRDGLHAGIYVLQEVYTRFTPETTTFKKKSNTASWDEKTNADAVLTSDGSWYSLTSADVTHTWDASKYIESNGHKYRWYMYYYTSTLQSTLNLNIVDNHAIEVFIGKCCTSTLGYGICNGLRIRNFEVQGDIYRMHTNNTSGKKCCVMPMLEHLYLAKINYWMHTNYVDIFDGCFFYLKSIDAPGVGNGTTGNYYLPIALTQQGPNVCELKLHANHKNAKLYLSAQNPLYDELIEAGYSSINIADTYDVIDTKLAPVINDSNLNNGRATTIKRNSYYRNDSPIVVNRPNLTVLDLRTWGYNHITLNAEPYFTIPYYNCPNINEIKLASNLKVRFDLTMIDVPVQILRDIIDSLIDISTMTDAVYMPVQLFGPENLAKLGEDEIAIATNKGWVIA